MGWGVWPNAADQQPLMDDHLNANEDQVPQLIPLQPEIAEAVEEAIAEEVVIAEEVINNFAGQANLLQNPPNEQQPEEQVLAMDELTDTSDYEPEHAPLPAEPIEVVPFPNLQNL